MEADQDISLIASNNNVEIQATAGQISAEGADGVLKIGAGIGLSSDTGDIDLNLSGGTGDINIQVSGGGTTLINGNNAGKLGFFAGTGVGSQPAGAAIGVLTGGNPYLTFADGQDIADTLNAVRTALIQYGLLF